ncbi:uncharacterized protein CANTADRAFT_45976 [Suhomyces tanzawaensis NRRL Y-17324]|uniref:Required for respiratory growth protein 9, mitochondrial n=1 Tax=Suhomyces tanzawaensis NRRL Y-17324 TaxID=984487 RepID=A0A1E4SRV3_9ASCO|nr:uncharacterized protein CANTADRAFT_45976 [Suhomyces tanzawaensis NRRL Y-17324]ODV82246.1 hypothetical protein CANTADRAFT_45976 [Suhomyces tanzawaensis NRRL Y-17324]
MFYRQRQAYSSKAEQAFIQRVREQEKKSIDKVPEWEKREVSLKKRYGNWNPTRKLSRQQISDIRNLSSQMPQLKTVDFAKHYKISPEAVRRILSSSWIPKESEESKILERGEKRKTERRLEKQEIANEIQKARSRFSHAKSINLNDITINNDNLYSRKVLSQEGKFKYDSNNSHGFYNKKLKKKNSRKPFSQSVSDVID